MIAKTSMYIVQSLRVFEPMVLALVQPEAVIRFGPDGAVTPAGTGHVEALVATVPHLPGLTELVVERGRVAIYGRTVDLPPVDVAKASASATVRLDGPSGGLRAVDLQGFAVATLPGPGPAALRATSGSTSGWRWRPAGGGIAREAGTDGTQLHLMGRPVGAPPVAAAPHYDMPGNPAGLYGPVLAGADLRLDQPAGGSARLAFDPPVAAKAVEIFLGSNGKTSAHEGLPNEATGVSWTATKVTGVWTSLPHDVTLTADTGAAGPGGPGPGGVVVTVAQFAGELSTQREEVDFTPAARAALAPAYDPAGSGDLRLSIRATASSAGELAADALTLEAHYRHAPVGAEPLAVSLTGSPAEATFAVPLGLIPARLTFTLDGRFGPARLIDGADQAPATPRQGARLTAGVRVARRLPLAGIERAGPLCRVGLLVRADTPAEVLVEVVADRAGRPGSPLADPVALPLVPDTAPAWARAALPEVDPAGAGAVWVVARATTGAARWYGVDDHPPAPDPGEPVTTLVSLDDGVTWDRTSLRPATQLHVLTEPAPEPLALRGPGHALLAADALSLPAARTRIEAPPETAVRLAGTLPAEQAPPARSASFRKEGVQAAQPPALAALVAAAASASASAVAGSAGRRGLGHRPVRSVVRLPARRRPEGPRRRARLRPLERPLMAGLLDSLDTLFAGAGISASIDVQLGPLDAVAGAVTALRDGPPDLADLRASIGAFPAPPGLDGLAGLAGSLTGLAGGLDVGFEGAFTAVLGPLAKIGGEGFGISAALQLSSALCLVQEAIKLATEGGFGGGQGLPRPADLWRRQGLPPGVEVTVDEIHDRMAELTASLDSFGPRLDGPRLLDLLRSVAPRIVDLRKWPTIPVVSDVLEVAAVAVEWSALGGPELTALLDARLARIGDVIALPRTRVLDPLLAQAEVASTLGARVDAALADLPPLLDRLARKTTETNVQPTANELALLRRHVTALEEAADALDLDGTPLGRLPRLVPDLELALMRATRLFCPSVAGVTIAARLDALLALIPPAEPDPLQGAVEAIAGIDLSLLTNPLGAVREAVEDVVTEIEGGLATVEAAVTGVLEPVADGLDGALAAANLDAAIPALAAFPAQIQAFVDTQVRPGIEPLRSAVSAAVGGLQSALDGFDPASLVAPLAAALQDLADMVGTGEVRSVVAQVEEALTAASAAVEGLDFAGVADEAVALLNDLEATFAGIDPVTIPEPAVPLVEAAIDAVASIDFTAEVGGPIVASVSGAVVAGPRAVLDALAGQMEELKRGVEQFRPSVVIGDSIDRPFRDLLETLESVSPTALLDTVAAELRGVADRVKVLDPEPLIAPLTSLHAQLTAALEAIRPSTLLQPVDEAIAAAIARLFAATGADDVFDGLDEALATAQAWIDVVSETEAVLRRLGAMLAEPGDVDVALKGMVDGLVAKLDVADLDALRPRFEALGAIVHSVEHGVVAAEATRALRSVQPAGAALAGPNLARLGVAARAFPRTALADQRPVPSRRRLAELADRLVAACDRLDAARGPWVVLSPDIDVRAPRLQADLTTYARLSVVGGRSVFADCIVPPADRVALQASVRAAASDGLDLPVRALFGLFARIAPHVAGLATGFADVVAAARAKLEEVTGGAGVGGAVDALEDAADLLRELDLSAVTGPLDAVFGRLETAVDALDPAPLADALRAAAAAVVGLLDLGALIGPADVAALQATYDQAVARVRSLQPSAVVAATLDPVYEQLVGDLLPVLDLPARLGDLLGTIGATLSAEVTGQLGRVEAAFDAMIKAIPVQGGRVAVSVSVSASASVGS